MLVDSVRPRIALAPRLPFQFEGACVQQRLLERQEELNAVRKQQFISTVYYRILEGAAAGAGGVCGVDGG